VHRLDRLNANIPANLFDSKLLTQEAPGQTDWPVYCSFGPTSGRSPDGDYALMWPGSVLANCGDPFKE
jgi:hypothetical protein